MPDLQALRCKFCNGPMERTGIEPVTSGLQSRESETTLGDA